MYGLLALHYAARACQYRAIMILFGAGLDVNARTKSVDSAFDLAFKSDRNGWNCHFIKVLLRGYGLKPRTEVE